MDPVDVDLVDGEKASSSTTEVPPLISGVGKDEESAKLENYIKSAPTLDSYEPKPKKSWCIDDPFEHAPEKPKEDQWAIMLEPLMDIDAAQCAVWKDEVGNLLIFAGLFSAVVTAFVIESYKSLQPDPNSTIIALLIHIASRLDEPLDNNGTSPPLLVPTPPQLIATSFSQASSSIRINVFWFLSLILSLTTVLVGTIALQWLREHQYYPNLSSKQKLAMLRMRTEAMERWHVPQIFSALPLLLQSGLALFFAGMVDFSLLLGMKIGVPVCVVIGLTLLFLLATTILPTLQGFAMYVAFLLPRQRIPSPCPYKSPQSQAFRTTSRLVFRFFHLVLGHFDFRRKYDNHLSPYIFKIWCQNTWTEFDTGWLFIRDACHQRIFDNEPHSDEHRRLLWRFWDIPQEDIALSDITQSLRESVEDVPGSRHTETFLLAATHCLEEVSDDLLRWHNSHFYRRNRYFHELLEGDNDIRRNSSLSDLFSPTNGKFSHPSIPKHAAMFHHEHSYIFIGIVLQNNHFPALDAYRRELRTRIMQHLFREYHKTIGWRKDSPLPTFLESYRGTGWLADQGIAPIVDAIKTLFSFVCSEQIERELLMESIQTHQVIPQFLSNAATSSSFYLFQLSNSQGVDGEEFRYACGQYTPLFQFIGEKLDNQRSTSPPFAHIPSPLFYLSSLFIRRFAEGWSYKAVHDPRVHSGLATLLDVMRSYREWINGSVDADLEKRFEGEEWFHMVRFSEEWWAFLDHPTSSNPGSSIASSEPTSSISTTYTTRRRV